MPRSSAGEAHPSFKMMQLADGQCRVLQSWQVAGKLQVTVNREPGEVADREEGAHTCQSGALIPGSYKREELSVSSK